MARTSLFPLTLFCKEVFSVIFRSLLFSLHLYFHFRFPLDFASSLSFTHTCPHYISCSPHSLTPFSWPFYSYTVSSFPPSILLLFPYAFQTLPSRSLFPFLYAPYCLHISPPLLSLFEILLAFFLVHYPPRYIFVTLTPVTFQAHWFPNSLRASSFFFLYGPTY